MKKTVLLLGLLFLPFLPVLAGIDHFEVVSVENGMPILEFEGEKEVLEIIPQLVKEYDCEGNVRNQFVQYKLILVQKGFLLGFNFSHIISKQALCELKAVANVTKKSMARGGKEGLSYDNPPLTLAIYYTPKSDYTKEGWKMSGNFGASSLFFKEGAAEDFIKALADINLDTAYFDSQNENASSVSFETIPDRMKELAKKDVNLYYAAWLGKSGKLNSDGYGTLITLFPVDELQSLMTRYSVEELEQMSRDHDMYFERFKKEK